MAQSLWLLSFELFLKANFDGAVFRELGEASIGVVIRDYKGMVLASMSERIILPPSVANLEALAVVRALNFAHEIGFPKIVLEGDSEVVIKALRREEESFASSGHLIAEAKSLLEAFSVVNFSYTRR